MHFLSSRLTMGETSASDSDSLGRLALLLRRIFGRTLRAGVGSCGDSVITIPSPLSGQRTGLDGFSAIGLSGELVIIPLFTDMLHRLIFLSFYPHFIHSPFLTSNVHFIPPFSSPPFPFTCPTPAISFVSLFISIWTFRIYTVCSCPFS